MSDGRHVSIGDTRLYIVERGAAGAFPLLVLHGGPGMDHHVFGDYLDPLTDEFRLILVDQRAQGLSDRAPAETWSLRQMAHDVTLLAAALDLPRFAVLGHSYGAFVVLQNAIDDRGAAAGTIISSGLPSARYLAEVWTNLDKFEPLALREQVRSSWERESGATTIEQVNALLRDQLPFQFGDPLDPRIAEYEQRTAGGIPSPDVLRHFAQAEYGGIEAEADLAKIMQPVLVIGGRLDRTCVIAGSEAMARDIPGAEFAVLEHSAHMTFAEEPEAYLAAVRAFLRRVRSPS